MKWNTFCLLLLAFIAGFITHAWLVQYEAEETGPRSTLVIDLDVAEGAYERDWADALAAHLGGQTEVVIELGRVDVVTPSQAIEVDWAAKWKEGLGQATYYGHATGKRPVVALIGRPKDGVIEALIAADVDVMVLE